MRNKDAAGGRFENNLRSDLVKSNDKQHNIYKEINNNCINGAFERVKDPAWTEKVVKREKQRLKPRYVDSKQTSRGFIQTKDYIKDTLRRDCLQDKAQHRPSKSPRRVPSKLISFDGLENEGGDENSDFAYFNGNSTKHSSKSPLTQQPRDMSNIGDSSNSREKQGYNVNPCVVKNKKSVDTFSSNRIEPESDQRVFQKGKDLNGQETPSTDVCLPKQMTVCREKDSISAVENGIVFSSPHHDRFQAKHGNDLKPSPRSRNRAHAPCAVDKVHTSTMSSSEQVCGKEKLTDDRQCPASPVVPVQLLNTPFHLKQAKDRVLGHTGDQQFISANDSKQDSGITMLHDESSVSSTVNKGEVRQLTLKNLEKFDKEMNEHSLSVNVSMNSSSQQLTDEAAVDRVEKWLFNVVETDEVNMAPHDSTVEQAVKYCAENGVFNHLLDDPQSNVCSVAEYGASIVPNLGHGTNAVGPKLMAKETQHYWKQRNSDKERLHNGPNENEIGRTEADRTKSMENRNRNLSYEASNSVGYDVHNVDRQNQMCEVRQKSPRQNLTSERYLYQNKVDSDVKGPLTYSCNSPHSSSRGGEGYTVNPVVSGGENFKDFSPHQVNTVQDNAGNVYVLENAQGENRIRLKIRKSGNRDKPSKKLSAEQIANEMKNFDDDLCKGAKLRLCRDNKRQFSKTDHDNYTEDGFCYGTDRYARESRPAPPKARKLHKSPYTSRQQSPYSDLSPRGHGQNFVPYRNYSPGLYVKGDAYRELTREQLHRVRHYEDQGAHRKYSGAKWEDCSALPAGRGADNFSHQPSRSARHSDWQNRPARRHSPRQAVNYRDSHLPGGCHRYVSESPYSDHCEDRHKIDLDDNKRPNVSYESCTADSRYLETSVYRDIHRNGIVNESSPKHFVNSINSRLKYCSSPIRRKVTDGNDPFSPSTSLSQLKLNTPRSSRHELQTANPPEVYHSRKAEISHSDMEASTQNCNLSAYKNYYGDITIEKQRRRSSDKSNRNEMHKSVPAKTEAHSQRQSLDLYDMTDMIHSGNIRALEKSLNQQLGTESEGQKLAHRIPDVTKAQYDFSSSLNSSRGDPRYSSGFLSLDNVPQKTQQLRVQRQQSSENVVSIGSGCESEMHRIDTNCGQRMCDSDSGFMHEASNFDREIPADSYHISDDGTSSNECMAEPLPDMWPNKARGSGHSHQSKICKNLFPGKIIETLEEPLGVSRLPNRASEMKNNGFKVPKTVPSVPSKRGLNNTQQLVNNRQVTTYSPSTHDRLRSELMYKCKSRSKIPLEYCQSSPIKPGTRLALDVSLSTIRGFEEPNSDLDSNEELVLI